MLKYYTELNRGHTIKPLTLTRFWHRRICEAVMLVALTILGLYFWAYFANTGHTESAFLVSNISAITAGLAFVAGLVSYFWAPKKFLLRGSLTAFVILCATSATLILSTGGISSPFIALWMIVSVFAGIFGLYGLLPLLLAIVSYMILEYTGGSLTREAVLTIILTGILPLAVSYLIWHTKAKTDTTSNKAYNELASELSQVSGKSEVLINAIADGVISLNSQGVIQLINPAAQQIIGWGKQDAISLDYKSVLKLIDKSSNELTPANDPIALGLATNKEVTVNDLSLVTNSGKKILVSVIVSPVGQLGSGVIVVFRDITKEKGEERQQAEFISTAAHEMRTPVAAIEGYLGLTLNPATANIDEKARSYVLKAHESVQHLGHLFQDLLDVSKADDGRLINDPKVTDVVAFTHDVAQGLRPKAEEKGLHFLFKPLPDDDDDKAGERRLNPVFYVNVDNDHLREVIANLIENAIKYTPKGDVTIDVSGDAEHVTISVADSGIGIPREDQGHLFQKFYRVDNSDTREIGGTGLGLYLCRRLTEAMNGRIWVESEYKQGSTFNVELPRIDHEEATRLIEAASIEEEHEADPTPAVTPLYAGTAIEELAIAPTIPSPESVMAVAPEPPIDTSEIAYTNSPVETVVQQLQSMNGSVIQQQPVAPPTPAIVPTPQPPVQPTYLSPEHTNVPLTSIEQNPAEYRRTRTDGVPIPPRNQN
ncbi:MAG: putative sensor protein [Candidatus Saccharibacteria bacterium]|nr:putative sensor protein [Candidatus Saccharibacteria bacterium]